MAVPEWKNLQKIAEGYKKVLEDEQAFLDKHLSSGIDQYIDQYEKEGYKGGYKTFHEGSQLHWKKVEGSSSIYAVTRTDSKGKFHTVYVQYTKQDKASKIQILSGDYSNDSHPWKYGVNPKTGELTFTYRGKDGVYDELVCDKNGELMKWHKYVKLSGYGRIYGSISQDGEIKGIWKEETWGKRRYASLPQNLRYRDLDRHLLKLRKEELEARDKREKQREMQLNKRLQFGKGLLFDKGLELYRSPKKRKVHKAKVVKLKQFVVKRGKIVQYDMQCAMYDGMQYGMMVQFNQFARMVPAQKGSAHDKNGAGMMVPVKKPVNKPKDNAAPAVVASKR